MASVKMKTKLAKPGKPAKAVKAPKMKAASFANAKSATAKNFGKAQIGK